MRHDDGRKEEEAGAGIPIPGWLPNLAAGKKSQPSHFISGHGQCYPWRLTIHGKGFVTVAKFDNGAVPSLPWLRPAD
jgi:hypothetical protein